MRRSARFTRAEIIITYKYNVSYLAFRTFSVRTLAVYQFSCGAVKKIRGNARYAFPLSE